MILFLAGAESHTKRLIDAGSTHLLYSYEYMRKKGVKDFAEHYTPLRNVEKPRIMIDSGAFTINRNPSEWPLAKCIAFRDEYIAWLIRNKDSINLAVELDLNVALNKEQLTDWRDNYFGKLERDHNIRICYVWHPPDKQSGWKEMCIKYDYVGLSQAGGWDTAKLSSYCRIARKHKAKIHAFGFTKPEKLVKMRPYSADSTSWINAMKYGTTFILDKNNFRVYDLHNKDIRNRYKRKYQQMGLDWPKIKADDPNETTKASIMEWVLLEKWINKRIKTLKNKPQIGSLNAQTDVVQGQQSNLAVATTETISLIRRPNAAQLACQNCHIGDSGCDRYNEKSTSCNYPLDPFPGDIESNDPLVRVQITMLKTDWDIWQRNVQFQQQQGGYTDRSIAAQGTQLFNSINALRESLKIRTAGGGLTPDSPLTQNAKSALGELFSGIGAALKDERPEKSVVTIEQPALDTSEVPMSPIETASRDKELATMKRVIHDG